MTRVGDGLAARHWPGLVAKYWDGVRRVVEFRLREPRAEGTGLELCCRDRPYINPRHLVGTQENKGTHDEVTSATFSLGQI